MSRVRVSLPKIEFKREKLHKLEYYRTKYDLSQEKMAELLGVCLSTYNQKVNGRQSFKYEEMIIIYIFLNKVAKKAGHNKISLGQIFLPEELRNSNDII